MDLDKLHFNLESLNKEDSSKETIKQSYSSHLSR
jgi:hypothetical protein